MSPNHSAAAAATATRTDVAARASHPWFYRGMGLVVLGIAAAAFTPALIDPGSRRAPLTPLVALHGGVFALWLVLYLAQTILVASRRINLHRRLGYAGGLLAVLMVAVGYASAIALARRGTDLSGDLDLAGRPLMFLVFPLGDLASFTVLVSAALWNRRKPEVHKRLMILATAGALMAAPLDHLIGRFVPVVRSIPPLFLLPLATLYFAAAMHDRWAHGRIHPVSLWGGAALLLWANIRAIVIGPSATWQQFAGWLVQ